MPPQNLIAPTDNETNDKGASDVQNAFGFAVYPDRTMCLSAAGAWRLRAWRLTALPGRDEPGRHGCAELSQAASWAAQQGLREGFDRERSV